MTWRQRWERDFLYIFVPFANTKKRKKKLNHNSWSEWWYQDPERLLSFFCHHLGHPISLLVWEFLAIKIKKPEWDSRQGSWEATWIGHFYLHPLQPPPSRDRHSNSQTGQRFDASEPPLEQWRGWGFQLQRALTENSGMEKSMGLPRPGSLCFLMGAVWPDTAAWVLSRSGNA